jgi:hypothetical protein
MESLLGPLPARSVPTLQEMRAQIEETKRLEQEHQVIRQAVTAFNSIFADLERALSGLLYVTINRTEAKLLTLSISPYKLRRASRNRTQCPY